MVILYFAYDHAPSFLMTTLLVPEGVGGLFRHLDVLARVFRAKYQLPNSQLLFQLALGFPPA